MTFTSIDFETATGYRNSACAVGIVMVENSVITDEYYTLIQPPDNYYWNKFIEIHGITSEHTANTDTFDSFYPEIYKRIVGRKIVAHNESFDRSVLQKSIEYYSLFTRDLNLNKNWECTLNMSRNLGFYLNKLSDCCTRLNIPLQHHEALSDARACAKLYLNYLQNQ